MDDVNEFILKLSNVTEQNYTYMLYLSDYDVD